MRAPGPSRPIGSTVILAILEGDGPLPEITLRGVVSREANSRIANGTAYLVKMDDRSEAALRIYSPDPRFLLVDLEDFPSSRFPGMPGYIGGAFARLFGKVDFVDDQKASAYLKFLGTAELLLGEGQRRLSTPRAAYQQAANEIIEYARATRGVILEIGIASLPDAATVMNEMAPQGGYSADSLGRLKFLWGAFIGECILKEFGGRWFEDPKIGEVVLIPRGPLPPAKVFPFPVAEHVIRRRGVEGLSRWLDRVKVAKASTDFTPPLVK